MSGGGISDGVYILRAHFKIGASSGGLVKEGIFVIKHLAFIVV